MNQSPEKIIANWKVCKCCKHVGKSEEYRGTRLLKRRFGYYCKLSKNELIHYQWTYLRKMYWRSEGLEVPTDCAYILEHTLTQ